MIRDLFERFLYRFELWLRDRREDYVGRPRTYLLILAVTLIVFGFVFVVGGYYSEPAHILVEPQRAKVESLESGFALFTWARSGKLCFAFMPKCKSGQFARNWFAKCTGECGISRLEEELSAFPEGTSIEWDNWPEKFGWPQTEVTDRIKKFAKAKHLNLTFCCAWLD